MRNIDIGNLIAGMFAFMVGLLCLALGSYWLAALNLSLAALNGLCIYTKLRITSSPGGEAK